MFLSSMYCTRVLCTTQYLYIHLHVCISRRKIGALQHMNDNVIYCDVILIILTKHISAESFTFPKSALANLYLRYLSISITRIRDLFSFMCTCMCTTCMIRVHMYNHPNTPTLPILGQTHSGHHKRNETQTHTQTSHNTQATTAAPTYVDNDRCQ